jgi:outer membrane protein assembly factor BamA
MIRSIGIFIRSLLVTSLAAQVNIYPLDSLTSITVDIRPLSNSKLDKWDGKVLKGLSENQVQSLLRLEANRFGFVLAEFDFESNGSRHELIVVPGPRYQWADVRLAEGAEDLLRKSNIDTRKFSGISFSPERLGKVFNKALTYFENNGFPFAVVQLDSVEIENQLISGVVKIDQGPFVQFDSLNLIGDLKIRESYIANYIGIKEGKPYNERAIQDTKALLAQNQFLTAVRPLEVRFDKEKTEVTLFLNQSKASRFDGIIGFLPDEQTGDLLITGDVSLHLENSLRQGEIIDLNWRRLQSNTQDLDAQAVLPYVLNSPISPDGRVKIYRRDTTFTDIFGQIGVRCIFSRNDFVRVFVDRQTTNLISTSQYESTTLIPQYLDRSITSYGLGLNFRRIDYLLNPAKGFSLETDVAVGNKDILENPALPSFIYDSLELNSIQYRANLNAGYYISIVPRLVWHQQFLGASLMNDQLFNNEAYRIGGLKSIRGFNEESIFATTFGIVKSELRYQIERNGYLFALFDQGWYENTSINRIGSRRDTPYSLGLGITIGTKAGIFSLSTAVGSQQGNPLLIRTTKFHFGFLSVF